MLRARVKETLFGCKDPEPTTLQLILEKVRSFREGTLILTILVVAVAMSFLSPHFLTVNNIRTTLLSFATNGIVVVGITIVMILGGIDLSVGSTMALAMVVSGKLFLLGMPIGFAVIFGLLAAAMVGVAIGFFVTRVGLSSFITTLAMMGIARGLCFVITQGTPGSTPEKSNGMSTSSVLPWQVWPVFCTCPVSAPPHRVLEQVWS